MSYQKLASYGFARQRGVVDVAEHDGTVDVLLRKGTDLSGLMELRRLLGRPVNVEMLDVAIFDARLAGLFSRQDNHSADVAEDVAADMDLSRLAQDLPAIEDLLEAEDDAPIIKLINALLTEALREGASDIHIEPFETRSVVRFRIDGKLSDVIEPKRQLHSAIVSRVKVMANLDISEKRLPQDGRITLRIAGRPVDVRVSTLPTGHGERAVLRLLDKSAGRLDLQKLGMEGRTLSVMHKLIAEPHGIVLVTGPTGSGKTTTLYAALAAMDASTTNIMTVEDPIEYDLDGVGQTQVNARIEMSFARALRAILRQDPDVIMIGEIRDLETAQIAVQASLTGHLVLATIHTNDAPGAVTRMVDMGIEPFLLASSLIGVLAQRLYRQLCPACKVAYTPDDAEMKALGLSEARPLYRAVGCEQCNQLGYKGRAGVYELLTVDDEVRRLIHDGASEARIRDYASTRGMSSLRSDGIEQVLGGKTTLEEVVRVTRES
ncbi:type II secretion system ATPase GspE [Chitinimonas sp. BJB300]|uniref:type II secretion system ATPase GspE n=1 Tax=Chitinimonas sp. BJB300 TaxID=1559339 RepID=UPI000C0D1DF0|nr:type II secretion system ATPase GspE [Chitinimonas sp. BJB300]PHV10167.1 type II secretion system protein GspE [Chitinimonas sp. BJB300]TSJ87535.1 type II secretion system protein GspE [Chitinimonas sp. BJB300]